MTEDNHSSNDQLNQPETRQVRIDPQFEQELIPQTIQKRHAIIIGVGRYAKEPLKSRPLKYCIDDAVAMESALIACGYDKGNILLLHTGESDAPNRFPTEISILRAITTKLLQVARDDLLLIYFAGHGYLQKNTSDSCLAAFDSDPSDSAKNRPYLQINFLRDILQGNQLEFLKTLPDLRDLLQNVSAAEFKKVITRRIVLIIDACHAGPDTRDGFAEDEIRGEIVDFSHGLVQLSASTKNQKAYEADGHGVFTRFICQCLLQYSEEAKRGTDKPLKISALTNYVYKQVHLWTQQRNYPFQWPSERIEGIGDMELVDLSRTVSTNKVASREEDIQHRYELARSQVNEVPKFLNSRFCSRLNRIEECRAKPAPSLPEVESHLIKFEQYFTRYRCQREAWGKLIISANDYRATLESEAEKAHIGAVKVFIKALSRWLEYAHSKIFDLEFGISATTEELAKTDIEQFRTALMEIKTIFGYAREFSHLLAILEKLNNQIDLVSDLNPIDTRKFIERFSELCPAIWDDSGLIYLLNDMDIQSTLVQSQLKRRQIELPLLPPPISDLPEIP